MPPISELTVTRNLVEPVGTSHQMRVAKEGTRSSSIGGGATRSLGATGRPHRERHRERRQVPQRRQQHRPHRGHRALRSAEPSQLQAESPRAARER